jgi:hypothetical protein
MTHIDPLSYIKAVLAKDFADHQQARRKPGKQALVITLSRSYGAMGEAIAEGLGQALGVPVYDREILERLASSAKSDTHRFQVHDEQSSTGLSSFLYSMVSGNPATVRDYRRHLCDTVLELAEQNCILVGRGAHLILASQKVFRLRVVGSEAVCARRVALDLSLSSAQAIAKVAEINAGRNKAIVDLFGSSIEHCGLDHAENFDLVINTDHFSAQGALAVVLQALREAGFISEVPAWPT